MGEEAGDWGYCKLDESQHLGVAWTIFERLSSAFVVVVAAVVALHVDCQFWVLGRHRAESAIEGSKDVQRIVRLCPFHHQLS